MSQSTSCKIGNNCSKKALLSSTEVLKENRPPIVFDKITQNFNRSSSNVQHILAPQKNIGNQNRLEERKNGALRVLSTAIAADLSAKRPENWQDRIRTESDDFVHCSKKIMEASTNERNRSCAHRESNILHEFTSYKPATTGLISADYLQKSEMSVNGKMIEGNGTCSITNTNECTARFSAAQQPCSSDVFSGNKLIYIFAEDDDENIDESGWEDANIGDLIERDIQTDSEFSLDEHCSQKSGEKKEDKAEEDILSALESDSSMRFKMIKTQDNPRLNAIRDLLTLLDAETKKIVETRTVTGHGIPRLNVPGVSAERKDVDIRAEIEDNTAKLSSQIRHRHAVDMPPESYLMDEYVRSSPFYFPGACFVCLNFPAHQEILKRCAKCKIIRYCSKEHQILHWSHHKHICKYLRDSREKSVITKIFTREKRIQWLVQQLQLCRQISASLGRPLGPDEVGMLMFPPICHVCGDLNVAHECSICHAGFYCSIEHVISDYRRHSLNCPHFLKAIECERYANSYFFTGMLPKYPTVANRVSKTYRPLTCKMYDIVTHQAIANKSIVGDSIIDRARLAWLSQLLTFPLTLIYGLQQVQLSPKLQERHVLRVHVVGATSIELHVIAKWEHVLHALPRLRRLELVHIGPELLSHNFEVLKQCVGESDRTLCNYCRPRGRQIVHHLQPHSYHDYFASIDYLQPDLIVCYHPQFSRYDSWPQSIEYMLISSPVLITGCSDIHADDKIIRAYDAEQIIAPVRNPFSGMKPVMCESVMANECGVQYVNEMVALYVLKSGRRESVPDIEESNYTDEKVE